MERTDHQHLACQRRIWRSIDWTSMHVLGTFIGYPATPPPGDAADWVAGGEFTSARLSPVETSLDARQLGLDIPIPFFVIQGREDHIAPFDVARAYLADVRAPKKAFIPIAGGHYACFTNPTEFVDALRRHVRPLAK